MSDPRRECRIPVNRRALVQRNGTTGLCTLVDLTAQGLQIFVDIPLLPGDRVEIECWLNPESMIRCDLTLTHAAERHAGGRLTHISSEDHRQLMGFLDRQSAANHNGH